MPQDHEIADDIISGGLKKSKSYHSPYGSLTYGEIKQRAGGKPVDKKARQMKKLIEQQARLKAKLRRRGK